MPYIFRGGVEIIMFCTLSGFRTVNEFSVDGTSEVLVPVGGIWNKEFSRSTAPCRTRLKDQVFIDIVKCYCKNKATKPLITEETRYQVSINRWTRLA